MRKEIQKSRVRKLEAAGGAFCFIAGILAATLGSLLTASGWITGVELHPWLHGAGTVLLVVTIPLIIFSGFCLDWAEQGPNKANDNRDLGQGKTSSEPMMNTREIRRGIEEVEVKQNKQTVSVQNTGTGRFTSN